MRPDRYHATPPETPLCLPEPRLGGDGDLDLDAGLDVDNDLLDNLGGGGKASSVSTIHSPL